MEKAVICIASFLVLLGYSDGQSPGSPANPGSIGTSGPGGGSPAIGSTGPGNMSMASMGCTNMTKTSNGSMGMTNMNFNLSTPQGIQAFLNMEGINPSQLVTSNCVTNGKPVSTYNCKKYVPTCSIKCPSSCVYEAALK